MQTQARNCILRVFGALLCHTIIYLPLQKFNITHTHKLKYYLHHRVSVPQWSSAYIPALHWETALNNHTQLKILSNMRCRKPRLRNMRALFTSIINLRYRSLSAGSIGPHSAVGRMAPRIFYKQMFSVIQQAAYNRWSECLRRAASFPPADTRHNNPTAATVECQTLTCPNR